MLRGRGTCDVSRTAGNNPLLLVVIMNITLPLHESCKQLDTIYLIQLCSSSTTAGTELLERERETEPLHRAMPLDCLAACLPRLAVG